MKLPVVAHHEAGHAVAAWHFGHDIDIVTINPGEDFAGRCIASPNFGEGFTPEAGVEPVQFVRMLEDIDVCFAGHEAEAAYTGRQNWVGSRVDREIAINLASYLCAPSQEISALLNWRRIRTRAFVLNRSPEIEAVAKALLERTTLTGDEVRVATNVGLFGEERAARMEFVMQQGDRWYDARDTDDLLEFEAALTQFYRDAYRHVLPNHRFGLHRPRLWGLVGRYGNLDDETRTWLLVAPAGVRVATVAIKQRLLDRTELGPFHLTLDDTDSLVGF